MRVKSMALCALIGFGFSYVAPAKADEIRHFKCTSSKWDSKFICTKKYSHKPGKTKEYRVNCLPRKNALKQVNCKPNHKAVSCTIGWIHADASGDTKYGTCSCTNWDITKKHNMKLRVDCNG